MTDALTVTWQHLADACIEHDQEHERRALAALARLTQRQPEEVPCPASSPSPRPS